MRPETLMLYKLIILYILSKADFPLSNSQLTNFILENDYTDYFNVQQTLGELISDDYIHSQSIRNTTLYEISDAGREAVEQFPRFLSQGIRDDVDKYLRDNKYQLLDEISTPAEFYKEKEGVFTARLQILERTSVLFEMSLSLTSKEEAEHVCGQWRQKSSKLYSQIITELMGY